MEEKQEKRDFSVFWKLGFMLLLGLILGIMAVKQGLAYDQFKWQFCASGNATGGQCDDYWESFKSAYGIQDKQNSSMSNYYNKTEIDGLISRIQNATMNRSDAENLISQKTSGNGSSTYVTEANFLAFKDSLPNTYAMKGYEENNSSSMEINPLMIILILAVLGLAVFAFKDKIFPQKKKSFSIGDADRTTLMEAVKQLNKERNQSKQEETPA